MKVHFARDVLPKNFGGCRRSEGGFVGAKKDLAIPRLRVELKQGPKRPAMHHTEAVVVIWPKNQGVNIVAPYCWIFPRVQILSGCERVPSYRLSSALRKRPRCPLRRSVPSVMQECRAWQVQDIVGGIDFMKQIKRRLLATLAFLFTPGMAEAQPDSSKELDKSKKKIENITDYNVVRPSTNTPSGYTGKYNYPPKKPSIDRTFVPVPGKPFDQTPHQKLKNPSDTQPKVQPSTTTYTAPTGASPGTGSQPRTAV